MKTAPQSTAMLNCTTSSFHSIYSLVDARRHLTRETMVVHVEMKLFALDSDAAIHPAEA